jgi:hypothetical protein
MITFLFRDFLKPLCINVIYLFFFIYGGGLIDNNLWHKIYTYLPFSMVNTLTERVGMGNTIELTTNRIFMMILISFFILLSTSFISWLSFKNAELQ